MSRTSQLFARVMLGSCLSVVSASGLVWGAVPVATSASSTGGVLKYETASGDTYLAIGLRAKEMSTASVARHHVVLMDTSASQFGEHRSHGFALLQAFLRGLPSDDRVSLLAVDVQAVRLTPEFVAPQSDAVRDALATLRKRVPLGATNFQRAIDAAIEVLPKETPATVLYIGDGISSVNLLSSQMVQQSLSAFREQHVPFSSYAVGPKRDLRLLGVMAQHTGGIVMSDPGRDEKSKANEADVAGQRLATAANVAVFYPERCEVSGAELSLASEQPLPLRTDRETIVLAKGSLTPETTIGMTGQLNGQTVSQNWRAADLKQETGTPFLAAAWKQASADGGLVPYAGRELLQTAWNEFDQRMEWLAAEGYRAVEQRRFHDAERLGQALQEVDPQNAQAKVLLTANQVVSKKPVLRIAKQDNAAQAPASEQPATDNLLNRDEFQKDVSSDRSLILDEETRIRVIGEKLKLEVSKAIQDARALSASEPLAAETLIKRASGQVKSTLDAPIDLRQQLSRQLQGVLADVRSQKEVAEQKQIALQVKVSVQEAERRLHEKSQLEDEKLESLIDRVRALMEDGARGNDVAFEEGESAAQAAVQMNPNSGVSAAARFNVEAAHQLNIAFRLRGMRAEKFLATLEQVEYSHVPFPDEPPVLFPPAEVWKSLSERRKQYASVDLHKSSPAERRIAASLSEQTEIGFTDSPLTDVVAFLSDYHNIPIIIDTEALNEEGIAPDQPVTRSLSGVTLRSALKIMLQPLALAYVIEDEVMKITTLTKEKDKLQTRVYPVGDLVIQLQPPQGGGGGQQGGGQQGGGQGGGGFGGGGQGGGGFGGGGAGFSIPVNWPPQKANAGANAGAFNNRQVEFESAKKKPSPKP